MSDYIRAGPDAGGDVLRLRVPGRPHWTVGLGVCFPDPQAGRGPGSGGRLPPHHRGHHLDEDLRRLRLRPGAPDIHDGGGLGPAGHGLVGVSGRVPRRGQRVRPVHRPGAPARPRDAHLRLLCGLQAGLRLRQAPPHVGPPPRAGHRGLAPPRDQVPLR